MSLLCYLEIKSILFSIFFLLCRLSKITARSLVHMQATYLNNDFKWNNNCNNFATLNLLYCNFLNTLKLLAIDHYCISLEN